MLGGNSSDKALPIFFDENRMQYAATNQLQLFGNIGCSAADQVNYFGKEHNSMLRPNKRGREVEAFPRQQKLQMSLNHSTFHDEIDRVASFQIQNPVSTGLRLSYDDDERNSSITSASGSMTAGQPLIMSLGENCKTELDRQKEEFDQYIKIQEENLVKGLKDIKQRHMASFLTAIEKSVGEKLNEKDFEIENINRKNRELVERIKQVATEAQNWHYKAKYNESLVNVLKTNLQQALSHGAEQMKEGFGDSEIDDTASCINTNNFLAIPSVPAKFTSMKDVNMMCRVCKGKEVSFLLLPCRHLCLCKDCEGLVSVCPVCQLMKTASVQISLVTDSPVNSSSSDGDDFAAFLDAELDSISDTSPDPGDDDNDGSEDNSDDEIDNNVGNDDKHDSVLAGTKRRKLTVSESFIVPQGAASNEETGFVPEASDEKDICRHPGFIGGMCIRCGKKMDGQPGVAFGYIHKDLRLANDEIARLRDRDLKNLFCHKKLYLVLDLDHTLLNSTWFQDMIPEEDYLKGQPESLPDSLKDSIFRLNFMHMMTKLRPFIRTFIKEASKLFEMYIYTMGERAYAMQMAKLLDPENIYFHSKVIAQGDCTQRHQKGLDVVLGQDSAVLILDDTEQVWVKHKENLILMERYHYFVSSYRQFGFKCESPSQLKTDESEADGALVTVLEVLKRIHHMFFNPEHEESLAKKDVLKTVKKEVLNGCKIVFSRVFPTEFHAESHYLWKMAEQLGATCSTEIDSSVTHVVSTDKGTEKSRWAMKENKLLVHPQWIEAANYLWKKQPEDGFPVSVAKQSK